MSAIEELRKRVEAATGPDREIDAEIDAALFGGRAAHTFNEGTPAARLRKSYDAGTVFTDTNPEINGGHVLSSMYRKANCVTASIEAALALVGRMAPKWSLHLYMSEGLKYPGVTMGRSYPTNRQITVEHRTVPLTILSALLSALDPEPPHGR